MTQRYSYAEYLKLAQQLSSTKLVPTLLALFTILFTLPSAQAASCKIPKSYYKNVACSSSAGYYLASKDFGAPVALIDSKGKPVVDLLRYQKVAADKIAGGLLPVQRNNRVGYINMQGREVVPIIYDALKESGGWARAVGDDRIIVKKDGHYGVINTSGKTIVPFSSTFSNIDNYRNNIAQVRKNKATSWLDKNGNPATDPNGAPNNATKVTNKTDLDKKVSTAESAAKPATFTTLQPVQQDGKWGFVDEQNTIMITYSFDEVRPFSEGLAAVRIEDNWGFVNLGGELVIPFNFNNPTTVGSESMFIFKEGKAWTGNLQNGDKTCIDKIGNITDCNIVKALDKNDSNLLSEIIEINGISEVNEISEIDEVSEISGISKVNEIAEISEVSETVKVIEINEISKVNEIVEIREVSKTVGVSEIQEVSDTNKFKAINKVNEIKKVMKINASSPVKGSSNITTTSVVSTITLITPKPAAVITLKPVKQDGKWGFVSEQKTIVVAYTFDEVRPFSEGLAGVRAGDKWGFIDSKGELVIPLKFAQGDESVDAMFVFNNEKAWIGNLQNTDKLCIDKKGNGVSCELTAY